MQYISTNLQTLRWCKLFNCLISERNMTVSENRPLFGRNVKSKYLHWRVRDISLLSLFLPCNSAIRKVWATVKICRWRGENLFCGQRVRRSLWTISEIMHYSLHRKVATDSRGSKTGENWIYSLFEAALSACILTLPAFSHRRAATVICKLRARFTLFDSLAAAAACIFHFVNCTTLRFDTPLNIQRK